MQPPGRDATRDRRKLSGTEPVTDYDSKTVMLRAERNDTIEITDTVARISDHAPVPAAVTVVQRQHTYYGPKLLVAPGREDPRYQLTAPGPAADLLLWHRTTDDGSDRWLQLAEVTAAVTDDQLQYTICSGCGEPIRTAEHERLARLDRCTGIGAAD